MRPADCFGHDSALQWFQALPGRAGCQWVAVPKMLALPLQSKALGTVGMKRV